MAENTETVIRWIAEETTAWAAMAEKDQAATSREVALHHKGSAAACMLIDLHAMREETIVQGSTEGTTAPLATEETTVPATSETTVPRIEVHPVATETTAEALHATEPSHRVVAVLNALLMDIAKNSE